MFFFYTLIKKSYGLQFYNRGAVFLLHPNQMRCWSPVLPWFSFSWEIMRIRSVCSLIRARWYRKTPATTNAVPNKFNGVTLLPNTNIENQINPARLTVFDTLKKMIKAMRASWKTMVFDNHKIKLKSCFPLIL